MTVTIFTQNDLEQISERNTTPEKILDQIETFKKGFRFSNLVRPCTRGNGITVLKVKELIPLSKICSQAASEGRIMKFVPASGAASRMFKLLLSFNSEYEKNVTEAEKSPDHTEFLRFLREIKNFAFYADLKSVMSTNGQTPERLIDEGQYREILDYILTPKGLNLSSLPKGLIPFHLYAEGSRTPFEEHLVEADGYAKDSEGKVHVHFTVSPESKKSINEHIEKIKKRYLSEKIRFEVELSIQKPSTDTIAVNLDNTPFREGDGSLLFRPGGHGGLIENLNDFQGDIIFIKNIDNIVPDRLKQKTILYKKVLGGYLIKLQDQVFNYIKKLLKNDADVKLIKEAIDFARKNLSFIPPENIHKFTKVEMKNLLISKLNRPIRVCGMVKNEGEPGGGPFWVGHSDGSISPQIVEESQVDKASAKQRKIMKSSTHFNPVDLVCGVRDYSGKPFNLIEYVDPKTGFISIKSKNSTELKALEHPGLWNGAMADWNTVFIDVPIETFNPVKTIMDLLRKEHQPE
jgi:hypothetical protein